MLAMEAEEYKEGSFSGKNEKKFLEMCNAIWDATSVATQTPCGRLGFLDTFLAVTGLTQFRCQEIRTIQQYRYWKVFREKTDSVQMDTVFRQRMGTDYEDFLLLGNILQILFLAQSKNKNIVISQKALYYLLHIRFPEAAKKLKIDRKEYVALQRRFSFESDDPYKYVYSLCPSYQYAFVEEQGAVYFPLPHLFDQCVTSSLLYRLTEGDNVLREIIGKKFWKDMYFD